MTTYTIEKTAPRRITECIRSVRKVPGYQEMQYLSTGILFMVTEDFVPSLPVATEAQIQQEALTSYLALEKKHEAEMNELKSRYVAALGGELKDPLAESESEPRPRMSEARMRELLAQGRVVRKAVEKDIAEMRHVSRGE